jgi:thiol-disulfide isomerase/thioredoxin
MNPEWVIRLLWALAIMAGGLGVYYLFSRFALRKARAGTPLLPQAERGRPILVYFTTPTCAPCKTIQRPAIQRLQDLLGDGLQVVEIDAAAQPEVASQWGVMSVPTTFLIDENGEPKVVNHGVAPFQKLLRQINGLKSGGN